jgi:hypothetical protein
MRRVLLVCASVAFAIACTDNITEPVPERPAATPGAARANPTVAFATTTTVDGFSISTDKDDYQPGDTVVITGSGWWAGETVSLLIEEEPAADGPHLLSAVADADGEFENRDLLITEQHLDVSFTLTATGQSSGGTVQTTFTDHGPSPVVATNYAISANASHLISVSVNLNGAASPSPTFTAAVARVANQTAGGTVDVNLTSPGSPGNGTWSGSFQGGCGTEYKINNVQVTWNAPGVSQPIHAHEGTATPAGNASVTTGDCPPSNVQPSVDAEKDADPNEYSGNEGSPVTLTGDASDSDGDPLTISWSYAAGAGVDVGATCTFGNASALSTTITCTDDGEFTLTLSAQETGTTNPAVTSTAKLTLANVAPTATVSPASQTINEGSTASYTATITDFGSNDVVASFVWTPTTGACTVTSSTQTSATYTCTDDFDNKVRLTVTDDDTGEGFGEASLKANNVAPVVGPITVTPNVIQVNGSVNLSSPFSDVGTGDTHTGVIDWDDGATSPATILSGSGTASGSHSYAAAGVYSVQLTVTDDDGGPGSAVYQYVVVYDPSAGFVTGGGWINSPGGAYLADGTLTGKATFGFVSKYLFQKDKTTPVLTGNTEFQFHAGNLNFTSSSYEWLVVNGTSKATYKGYGSVNGVAGYGFLLSVVDGSPDKFRMKIWQTGGSVVYDNQIGAGDDAEATTAIAGGSIVIHVPKKTT